MKKIYTLLVIALLVPSFALAAPKQRITIPFLKKQVASLTTQNKALRAEIEALRALQTKTSSELSYCKANPVVIEKIVEKTVQLPPIVQYYTPPPNDPADPSKIARINVGPVTDDVEINGLKTMIAVTLQILPVRSADIVTLTGATILKSGYENGSYVFTLAPESSSITLTINNKTVNSTIVVTDTPDMGSGSNKRVVIQGETTIEL